MSKLEDRAARAKVAMARRMRRLVGSGQERGDLEKARARIRSQQQRIKHLEQELANARNGSSGAPGAEVPVFFLIGRSKSGTGWLKHLLNFHPEVLCWGEGHFFGREERRSTRAQIQETTEGVRSKPIANSLYNALADSDWLRLWIERSVWGRKEDPEEHIKNLTHLAVNYFMSYRLAKTKKRVVGDKTPLNATGIVREISEVYPGAKVIHIVRDGRDQNVSLIHHSWKYAEDRDGMLRLKPDNLARRDAYEADPEGYLASGESIFSERYLRWAARKWANITNDACENGRTLLGDDYVEVKYKDLLARPEEEARHLFEFLGVRTAKTIVRRCVEKASFEKLSGKERGQEDAGTNWRKYRKGVAGDWQNVFTERDKEIFKEEAGEVLIRLGYERDLDW